MKKFIFENLGYRYEFFAKDWMEAEDKILECLRIDCAGNHQWDKKGVCRLCDEVCEHNDKQLIRASSPFAPNDYSQLIQCTECEVVLGPNEIDGMDLSKAWKESL